MLRKRIVVLACALVPAGALAMPTSPTRALHQEIAALQVDHALNLTPQQAQSLLPLLTDVRAKLAAVKAERASAEPALTAALTQAVADLKASGAISPATAQAVQAARGNLPATLREDVRAFWQQAKPVLTADQLKALKVVKLGVPPPSAAAATPRGHGHGRFARRLRIMHTFLSDEFLALVQARAG